MFLGALRVEGAAANTTFSITAQPGRLYALEVRDSDGIASFSINIPGDLPYSGDVQCPKTFKTNNVTFQDAPFPLSTFVIDCKGNRVELNLPNPDEGTALGQVTAIISAETETTTAELSTAASGSESSATTASQERETSASSDAKIQFPVPELGNCADELSCRAYCDRKEHRDVCFEFAKKNGLIPPEEIAKIEKFKSIGTGPGGCDSPELCESYCNDTTHIKECVAFAETHGLMTRGELEEARKVRDAIDRGEKLPGGCKNKTACEAYCKNPEHMDECLAFAESSGIMPKEELERAKRVLPLMKQGKTPGSCRSEEECRTYCEAGNETRLNECFAFAEANGLMSQEELGRFRKFKEVGGPGGCKSKEQCDAFCKGNQSECFKWAKDNQDLIPEKDRARMREGMRQVTEALKQAPPEVAACLRERLGEEAFTKISSGELPDPSFAESMRACFESAFGGHQGVPPEVAECLKAKGIDIKNMEGPPPPELEKEIRSCIGEGSGFPGEPDGPGGMGGSLPPEVLDCLKANGISMETLREGPPSPAAQECFAKMGGGFPGQPDEFPGGEGVRGFGNPAGCSTPEECRALCEKNPDMCRGFGDSSGGSIENQGVRPLPSQFPKPTESVRDIPSQYPEQYQDQYREQYQEQYQKIQEQQYQEQYQKIQEQYPGSPSQYPNYPNGEILQPGTYPQPETYPGAYPEFPNGGTFEPPPQSRYNPPTFLGFFAEIFLGILR